MENYKNKIVKLEVSKKWKIKFNLILEASPITKFGFPKYKNIKILSSKGFMINPTFNGWAFFFGPLYYFTKGMWKKALTLLGVGVLWAILLTILEMFISVPQDFQNAITFGGFGALYSTMASYDYYRTKVLKENFWW